MLGQGKARQDKTEAEARVRRVGRRRRSKEGMARQQSRIKRDREKKHK